MESLDVRQLGPVGVKFHRQEPPSEVGLDSEPGFQLPITVEFEAKRVGTSVVVKGEISARVQLGCSRCLEPVELEVRSDVALEFVEGPQPEKKEDVVEDEEVEVVYYTPPLIDLSDDLRQLLLVAIPAYPVCRDDCKGLCPECGMNRNTVACKCRPPGKEKPFEALGQLIEKEQ